jgi:hypothetical protein
LNILQFFWKSNIFHTCMIATEKIRLPQFHNCENSLPERLENNLIGALLQMLVVSILPLLRESLEIGAMHSFCLISDANEKTIHNLPIFTKRCFSKSWRFQCWSTC